MDHPTHQPVREEDDAASDLGCMRELAGLAVFVVSACLVIGSIVVIWRATH